MFDMDLFRTKVFMVKDIGVLRSLVGRGGVLVLFVLARGACTRVRERMCRKLPRHATKGKGCIRPIACGHDCRTQRNELGTELARHVLEGCLC